MDLGVASVLHLHDIAAVEYAIELGARSRKWRAREAARRNVIACRGVTGNEPDDAVRVVWDLESGAG
jgi:hypothetical protein